MLKKYRIFFLFCLLIISLFLSSNYQAQAAKLAPTDGGNNKTENVAQKNQAKLPVYLFWGDGCPHCHAEMLFLDKIKNDYPQIDFIELEVFYNKENRQRLAAMAEKMGVEAKGVPMTFIGGQVITGFRDEETSGVKIKQALDNYLNSKQLNRNNNANQTATTNNNLTTAKNKKNKGANNKIVKLPLIGKIDISQLSLPVLTGVLGLLDGFNPCSMWALVVLITLLINTGSRKKMWLVGSIFILASALSYYLFLAAWLNTFLLIGYLKIVQIGVGIFAIVVGIYFLYDFIKKRKQNTLTCEVSSDKIKDKIILRLENILRKKSIWAIIGGVIIIAFSVNLIELICSAGIPAIYTQTLTQNHLHKITYYLYLLLYDFFYMLDDIVVLVAAGITWQLVQGTGKYTKYSHLIGGLLVLILGIIMLLDPSLLNFK